MWEHSGADWEIVFWLHCTVRATAAFSYARAVVRMVD